MKGFIEITIPTIQYGNIHINQKFSSIEERSSALSYAIRCGKQLNNCVQDDKSEQKMGDDWEQLLKKEYDEISYAERKQGVTSKRVRDGIEQVLKDNRWQYWNPIEKIWTIVEDKNGS